MLQKKRLMEYFKKFKQKELKLAIEKAAERNSGRDVEKEALKRALQEMMEVVLESQMFTDAAKKGMEYYEYVVLSNIPFMVDSVMARCDELNQSQRDLR